MFESILENKYFNHLDFDNNLKIVKEILKHINSKVFISLSGGVDSMVLTVILKKFYNIECIHINYDNRKESNLEKRFLNEWCDFYRNKITYFENGRIQYKKIVIEIFMKNILTN